MPCRNIHLLELWWTLNDNLQLKQKCQIYLYLKVRKRLTRQIGFISITYQFQPRELICTFIIHTYERFQELSIANDSSEDLLLNHSGLFVFLSRGNRSGNIPYTFGQSEDQDYRKSEVKTRCSVCKCLTWKLSQQVRSDKLTLTN